MHARRTLSLALLLPLPVLFAASVAARGDTAVTVWGEPGTEPGQLLSPQALAVDADGNLFVADALNHRIQKFTGDGALVTVWGGRGDGPGELDIPQGVTVDARGDVWVTDVGNYRVQRFSNDGGFLSEWPTDGGRARSVVYGIAVDPAGDLWLAAADTHEIRRFGPAGEPRGHWGSFGEGPGTLRIPRGIALGEDAVYVVDSRDRVQAFAKDGTFRAEWGGNGSPVGLRSPRDVATGPDGNLYVVDAGNFRVQVLAPDGTLVRTIGSYGREPGRFLRPTAVAVDGQGNVFVAETRLNRIQKFAAP